tara:strand:- start:218 stop:1030 length:813 start_codon:yes stop_codon:yes gene_type:complete
MVPYKKQSSEDLQSKIQYYFEKSLAMSEFDLEAMMMFARNLNEVLTTLLYIQLLGKEPHYLKTIKKTIKGELKETKVKYLKNQHSKIREIEKKDMIPQSILICLNMLSSAGNVSVHGSEILDKKLNEPLRKIILFICDWFYVEYNNSTIPSSIDLSESSDTFVKEKTETKLSKIYSRQHIKITHSVVIDDQDLSISYNSRYGGSAISSYSYWLSCVFSTDDDVHTIENQNIRAGSVIKLGSESKQAVITVVDCNTTECYVNINVFSAEGD